MKRFSLFILIGLFFCLTAFNPEQQKTQLLFKIERSKDANQIFYTVNTDEAGNLDYNPITIFWIKKTKKNRIEPLTWIQKKYAYGLKYLQCDNKCALFQFVSYDKANFILKKTDQEYKVYTKMNDRVLEVERIYVHIDGGTFWVPNITQVELFAQDLKTGEAVVESIQP